MLDSRSGLRALVLTLAVFLSVATVSADATNGGELRFLTEEFPPLSLTENDELTGHAVELVRALRSETGTRGAIEIMEWSEAYRDAQHGSNTVLFSTVLTPERKEHFQWVGPTAVLHTGLYALADSDIAINTLDQARDAASIATVTDYYSDQLLAAEGDFDNVVRFADELEATRALLDGRVELMVADNTSLPEVLEQLDSDISAVRRVFAVSTDLTYLAFSPDIPADTVERWQEALDAMKSDGRFADLYQRWLPAETPPGRFYLVTEEYPPITFMHDGQVSGFVTDIVREVASELGVDDRVQLTSWQNAYQMALLHPNVVLFSAERTDSREQLFHWVGPVGRNTAMLYAREGQDIEVDTLTDARRLDAVATTTDWFTEQHLQAEGFDNLLSSPDPADSVRRLMSGEADLAVFTDLTVGEIVARAGYDMDDLKPVRVVSETDFYVALSSDTDAEDVADWRRGLEVLKADGRFERIYRRYLPDADLSELLD